VSARTIDTLADPEAVAQRAAELIADRVRACVGERGAFSLALSGGRVERMLVLLDGKDVHWEAVTVFQVDERVAPYGDADRNLAKIERALPRASIVAMPVEDEDLAAAAGRYAALLPGRLDLVHLGLGADGHTASLVPNCGALEVSDRDVAISREYNGRRRMTLTYPAIDRAREVLWVVTGEDKAEALAKLLAGDETIPAARVRAPVQTVLTDQPVPYP